MQEDFSQQLYSQPQQNVIVNQPATQQGVSQQYFNSADGGVMVQGSPFCWQR